MSTNYYARTVACPHCGRSDGDIHICQNLASFQGFLVDEDGRGGSPWGEIKTWADWRRILREHSVQIFDEYGQEHDIEQFIAGVEAVPLAARRRQYDYMVDRYGPDAGGVDWLDPDGFSFCSQDFS